MLLLLSCISPQDCPTCYVCGPGTHAEGDVCIPDEADADTDADTDADADCGLLTFRRDYGHVWTMDEDGGSTFQVTSVEAENGYPSLSPDCSRIAFTRNGSAIYTIAVDGSDEQLVYQGGTEHWRTPRWSPDGTMLSASSDLSGTNTIYVMNLDGSGLTAVTDGTVSSSDADWSPDGASLLFTAFGDLAVIGVDGSGLTLITSDAAWDSAPKWSPDGTMITFQSTRDGGSHIFVADADGSNITAVTSGGGEYERPDWSPDGTWLAYRGWTGNAEIMKSEVDGSNQTNLTNTGNNEFEVDWR